MHKGSEEKKPKKKVLPPVEIPECFQKYVIKNSEIVQVKEIAKGKCKIFRCIWKREGKEDLPVVSKSVVFSRDKDIYAALNEFQLHLAYQGDYVVKVYGCNVENLSAGGVMLTIIMEAMDCDLMDYLAKNPKLPLADKIDLMVRMGECLHSLHVKNMLHRDIKPIQFLIRKSEDGKTVKEVKLTDLDTLRYLDVGLTHVNSFHLYGTPIYDAPEILSGRGEKAKFGVKSEVYSFGISLFQMLHMKPPYEKERSDKSLRVRFLMQVQRGELTPTFEIETDQELKDLIKSMWKFDRKERPTLVEVMKKLKEIAERLRSEK